LTGKQNLITTRQRLISHSVAEWNEFVAYIDSLTDEHWLVPKDAAGWSVKDHVSHVARWDSAVIELFRNDVPMQQTLGISDEDWTLDDYNPMNEQIRQRTIEDPVDIVKSDRGTTWAALLTELEVLSDDQLAAPPGEAGINTGDESAPTLLQELVGYLGGHYAEHLGCIRIIVEGSA